MRFAFLLATLLVACEPPPPTRAPGTEAMAAELAEIHAAAVAGPMAYFHLNSARADALERQIAATQAPPDNLLLAYANELLSAGRTDEALRVLYRLAGQAGSTITPENRAVYDLLALAHLRQGEEDNCLDGHAASACILPIDAEAIHERREGAERAARLYERLLEADASDAQAWLLNVAHQALGTYPARVPEPFLLPGLDAEAAFPRFRNVAPAVGVAVDGLSGGVCADDFDGDGLLDLFVTSYGLADPVRLLLANGQGAFEDHTKAAGLGGITSGLNAVCADADNDGDTDVFVLRGAWLGDAGAHPNSFLRNEGDGTFHDATAAAGLLSRHPTQTAAWADVDLDGDLDLFVGNESNAAWQDVLAQNRRGAGRPHPSELFLNRGDGTFFEAADSAGLAVDAFVKGVTWGHVNDDLLPDLYVSVLGGPNKLFLNRSTPEALRFEEVAEQAGVTGPAFSFPTWFFDADHDGRQDLLVLPYDVRYFSDVAGEVAREALGRDAASERARLYRNNGDGSFADATAAAGLDRVLFAMGSGYGDLDNDGFFDLYVGTGAPDLRSVVPNRMFRNRADGSFEEVTFAGGFGHIQKGHAVAWADFDRDGDQDVYAVMGGAVEGDHFPNVLFENPTPTPDNAWTMLVFQGRTANRDALGARVRLVTRDASARRQTFHHVVGRGGSFGSSSPWLEAGLGDAVRIDTLEVRWPALPARRDVYTDLPVREPLRITEGAPAPERLAWPPIPFGMTDAQPHAHVRTAPLQQTPARP